MLLSCKSGIVLAVVAVALLVVAALFAQNAVVSWTVLALLAVVIVAGFWGVGKAVETLPERPRAPGNPDDWRKWPQTVGIILVGLVGLLVYVGIYLSIHAGLAFWVLYPALALVVVLFIIIISFSVLKE